MQSVFKFGFAGLALATILGCDPGQPLFGPREVDVGVASRRVVPELIDVPARLDAPARVDVTARTQGYLLDRAFEDGTEVEQNRILFVLQSDLYEAADEAARSALAGARAELEAAEARAARPGEDEDDLQIARAQATVDALAAAAKKAELELAYTTLRAPIGGRIDAHPIDVGNVVNPGDRLATIVQLDPIHVYFEISPQDLLRLEDAQRESPIVTMVVEADGRVHPWIGRVDVIGGEFRPATGGVQVRAVLPNPRTDLLAGQDVRARLLLRWHDGVVVPRSAVGEHRGETVVWVVDAENRVERRVVTPGPEYAGSRLIRTGIADGERVVVGRARAAVPGRRVNPIPTEPQPQPTPELARYLAPPVAEPSAEPNGAPPVAEPSAEPNGAPPVAEPSAETDLAPPEEPQTPGD